jgi:glycerophosphoryl diester phosphodiesterase
VIITHRGKHNNGLKENTIPSFEAALKAGAEAVECDLRLTLDKQIVVCHDNKLSINGKRFKVSKTTLQDLKNVSKDVIPSIIEESLSTVPGAKDPSTRHFASSVGMTEIDELFDYIRQKRVPFFLEVKNRSSILVESIAQKIKDKKLWDRVHIIGFSIFIKNALRAQAKHEKLRVLPIINYPLYSYIKTPSKSYGVFIGWLDKWYGSEWIFKRSVSKNRLIKLKKFYEKNGFKVMAGVINKETGFKYFEQAGIVDIVTDNIKDAVRYFNKNSKFES